MAKQRNPGKMIKWLEKIVEALEKHLPPETTHLIMSGKRCPVEAVLSLFRSHLNVFREPEDMKLALEMSLQRRLEKTPAIKDDIDNLRPAVAAVLGAKNQKLRRFGFRPHKKRRRLTGEERVRKAARAAATRKLRGTLGRRQKRLLKASLRDATPTAPHSPPTAGPPPAQGR